MKKKKKQSVAAKKNKEEICGNCDTENQNFSSQSCSYGLCDECCSNLECADENHSKNHSDSYEENLNSLNQMIETNSRGISQEITLTQLDLAETIDSLPESPGAEINKSWADQVEEDEEEK